jgi:hypothetical protein
LLIILGGCGDLEDAVVVLEARRLFVVCFVVCLGNSNWCSRGREVAGETMMRGLGGGRWNSSSVQKIMKNETAGGRCQKYAFIVISSFIVWLALE